MFSMNCDKQHYLLMALNVSKHEHHCHQSSCIPRTKHNVRPIQLTFPFFFAVFCCPNKEAIHAVPKDVYAGQDLTYCKLTNQLANLLCYILLRWVPVYSHTSAVNGRALADHRLRIASFDGKISISHDNPLVHEMLRR